MKVETAGSNLDEYPRSHGDGRRPGAHSGRVSQGIEGTPGAGATGNGLAANGRVSVGRYGWDSSWLCFCCLLMFGCSEKFARF